MKPVLSYVHVTIFWEEDNSGLTFLLGDNNTWRELFCFGRLDGSVESIEISFWTIEA